MKLGSLFDGIGGFPAAGLMCGIEPVWASEIEKFPCAVTAARFPKMKQLGDITQIDGGKIEPVDIITFGSPCQDLSVAGKQKGIHDGERSNLFFEAIRIIKEMRAATDNKYPRFAVWENVPGAQSSNKGEDFRSVIEAFISIVHDSVSIPRPEKWFRAGGVASDRFSLAWRMYDAQYWGVPQRRKRIYLVADFRGQCAGEILFEREGLRGDSAQSREARERIASSAERSTGGGNCCGCDLYNGELTGNIAATFGANSGMSANHSEPSVCCLNSMVEKCTTSYTEQVSPTLCSDSHGTPHAVCAAKKQTPGIITCTTGSFTQVCVGGANTLMARDYKGPQIVCCEV